MRKAVVILLGKMTRVCFSRAMALWLLPFLGMSVAGASTVYGYVEKVRLMPGDLVVKAKLDTGANTASLNAIHVVEFYRDKQKWVRFEVPMADRNVSIERPLLRHVRIKARSAEVKKYQLRRSIRRPVVSMRLTMGDTTLDIDVNLANRSDFNYPLLLGRKPLTKFDVLVDPSQVFLSHLEEPV